MKSNTRMWLKAAAATVGVSALTFGAVLPATAADNSGGFTLADGIDEYATAAAQTGSTVKELKSLEDAGSIRVLKTGTVIHVDAPFAGKPAVSTFNASAEGGSVPGTPADGSRPGAPVTIYLDFDGESLTKTEWNDYEGLETIVAEPSSASKDFQAEVWAAVAEDYAPFNVNVTTSKPSDDKLYKTSMDDNEYGSHVIITDSSYSIAPRATEGGASGVALNGRTGSEYGRGAFVFVPDTTLSGNPADANPKSVADTASHEAGHNFGLKHDGIVNDPDGDSYYGPAAGAWGPIMGSTYQVPLSQWSKGDYADATNTQDDLATITNREAKANPFAFLSTPDGEHYFGSLCIPQGVDLDNLKHGDRLFLPNAEGTCEGDLVELTLNFTFYDRADYAADQVGNDAGSATALENKGTFSAKGVIERTGDVDVFSVITAGGEFVASAQVLDKHPNLDAKLTLTDASGKVIAKNDPASAAVNEDVASGLDASVTAVVEPGVYYLAVDGVGQGDPSKATFENSNGYSDYASLGNYTLKGTAAELITEPVVITTPADGAKVEGGTEVEITGTATPNATVTVTVGDTKVSAEADANGEWTSSFTANKYGNTVAVASQKVGTIALPETDEVTVTAPVDAPVIKAPADGSTTEDTTPTISGTGIPGAVVKVGLSTGNGGSAVGTATVDAAGNWSLDVPTALAAGAYTASATQTVNGVDSTGSNLADFIVKVVVPTTPPTDNANGGANGGGGGAGANGGTGGSDDNLATTGGDFNAVPFTLLAAAVLLAGGATAVMGARQRRKASVES